jgi:hypothetical protein
MYKDHKAHDLRDLLSLARLLRDFADHHDGDASHDQFLSTAEALEAQAHIMADTPDLNLTGLFPDRSLYAPVNRLI